MGCGLTSTPKTKALYTMCVCRRRGGGREGMHSVRKKAEQQERAPDEIMERRNCSPARTDFSTLVPPPPSRSAGSLLPGASPMAACAPRGVGGACAVWCFEDEDTRTMGCWGARGVMPALPPPLPAPPALPGLEDGRAGDRAEVGRLVLAGRVLLAPLPPACICTKVCTSSCLSLAPVRPDASAAACAMRASTMLCIDLCAASMVCTIML